MNEESYGFSCSWLDSDDLDFSLPLCRPLYHWAICTRQRTLKFSGQKLPCIFFFTSLWAVLATCAIWIGSLMHCPSAGGLATAAWSRTAQGAPCSVCLSSSECQLARLVLVVVAESQSTYKGDKKRPTQAFKSLMTIILSYETSHTSEPENYRITGKGCWGRPFMESVYPVPKLQLSKASTKVHFKSWSRRGWAK